MVRLCCLVLIGSLCIVSGAAASDAVKSVTIRAPRDMGYFAGDLVKVSVEIVVADGYDIETPSLPHPGPVNYWLDLRTIDVAQRANGSGTRLYTLLITYQDFYDALDARPQEIPTFPVTFKAVSETATASVPAWTIGVSPLREVSPPPKSDPKGYMRPDAHVPLIKTDMLWWGAFAALVGTLFATLLLSYDRGIWPFRSRPTRAFADVWRALRKIAKAPDTDERYLDALLTMHRGIDRTAGRRVLADDLQVFLSRHPTFMPLRDGLSLFFTASRDAFFGSNPARSRAAMPLKAVEQLARDLAVAERMAAA